VEHIFDRLGFAAQARKISTFSNDVYSAAIQFETRGGKKVAEVAIIRKKILKSFDIENEVFYADINWNELMRAIKNAKVGYAEISKYPAVKRDLALLVDKAVTFAQIEQIARETEKKLLKEVALFDVYEGKNLEEGKKSYAVSFVLQDDNQTLNDKQIDKVMARLMDNFEKRLGAKQR
jgi:phenylalanyl-tRNA synthetase beta chain